MRSTAAFALALAEGRGEAAALRFAAAVAGLKCTRLGGSAGLPTRAEVDAFMAQYDRQAEGRRGEAGGLLASFGIFFSLDWLCPARLKNIVKAGVPELSRGLQPMDAIDRKILSVLQEDAALSVAEIGSRVGLSSTPCWKRIQRLEAEGVILKRVALVDQDRIGLGISVFVSIETDDHSQDWLSRFAKVVGAMPEVMEFYRMAGDVDYMLRVVVSDMAGYETFYKRLIAAVPLKNVTSRFAMEKIKSTTALPIA